MIDGKVCSYELIIDVDFEFECVIVEFICIEFLDYVIFVEEVY